MHLLKFNFNLKLKTLLISTAFILGLTSCAAWQTSPNNAVFDNSSYQGHYQTQAWSKREQALAGIQGWGLQGALGIRTQRDSVSATLTWQQYQNRYHIQMFSPLGTQSFVLSSNGQNVMLAMSNGRRYMAANAESLLAQQTGWNLPVSYLYYWVRGLPVPAVPVQKRFDDYQHLAEMMQAGWHIRYLGFMNVKNIDLPAKIALENPQLSIKLVIHQWNI